MRFNLSVISAAAFLAFMTTSAYAVDTGMLSKSNDIEQNSSAYWTPERMKSAQPLPIPRARITKESPQMFLNAHEKPEQGDGAPPQYKVELNTQPLFTPLNYRTLSANFNRGTANENFSSSRLVPITADVSYPYSTIGKLFFTIPGKGDFVCSAGVIRHRVIVTAGHCVHQGSNGVDGFYTNWLFVPAYRDGAAPFQSWNWSYVTVTGTWASGGGVVPNAADYAFIELKDKPFNGVLRRIGTVTGYLGYQTLSLFPNHAHMLGYPCNFDSCRKMHQVAAQSAKTVAPNNAEYGSDMRGGSSGGPWVQNFGALAVGQTGGANPGLNRVIAVTSWGYVDTARMAQGASIPDSRFSSLLASICGHQAGNCA